MTVRRAVPDDLPMMHALGAALIRDGRGQVVSTHEIDDLVAYARRVEPYFAKSGDAAIFVAEEGGRVVGEAGVRRLKPSMTRHVGVFHLGVHPEAQRRGHGRALVRACVAWCEGAGITRLELYVRADNDRARALYASEGFTHEGTRARFIRLPDGREVDDLIYVRFF
jgi:putative acetyltransferase